MSTVTNYKITGPQHFKEGTQFCSQTERSTFRIRSERNKDPYWLVWVLEIYLANTFGSLMTATQVFWFVLGWNVAFPVISVSHYAHLTNMHISPWYFLEMNENIPSGTVWWGRCCRPPSAPWHTSPPQLFGTALAAPEIHIYSILCCDTTAYDALQDWG